METIKEEVGEEITGTIETKITTSIVVNKARAKIIKMYIVKIKQKVAVTGDRKNNQKDLKLT